MTARTVARTGAPTWIVAAITGLFGLLYAYAVWSAVTNLVVTGQSLAAAGLALNAMGWIIWILAIAVPLMVFAAAFTIGRRRAPWLFALVMLAGLGVVAVFWLDVIGYTALNAASLIG